MIEKSLQWLLELADKKKWSWKHWVVLIVGVFIIILSIPRTRELIRCGFVMSFGQSGGQTACTIYNYKPLDRHLNDEITKELEEYLSGHEGQTIAVLSVIADSESYDLANEIDVYLQEYGWKTLRMQNGEPMKPGISFKDWGVYPAVQVGKNE